MKGKLNCKNRNFSCTKIFILIGILILPIITQAQNNGTKFSDWQTIYYYNNGNIKLRYQPIPCADLAKFKNQYLWKIEIWNNTGHYLNSINIRATGQFCEGGYYSNQILNTNFNSCYGLNNGSICDENWHHFKIINKITWIEFKYDYGGDKYHVWCDLDGDNIGHVTINGKTREEIATEKKALEDKKIKEENIIAENTAKEKKIALEEEAKEQKRILEIKAIEEKKAEATRLKKEELEELAAEKRKEKEEKAAEAKQEADRMEEQRMEAQRRETERIEQENLVNSAVVIGAMIDDVGKFIKKQKAKKAIKKTKNRSEENISKSENKALTETQNKQKVKNGEAKNSKSKKQLEKGIELPKTDNEQIKSESQIKEVQELKKSVIIPTKHKRKNNVFTLELISSTPVSTFGNKDPYAGKEAFGVHSGIGLGIGHEFVRGFYNNNRSIKIGFKQRLESTIHRAQMKSNNEGFVSNKLSIINIDYNIGFCSKYYITKNVRIGANFLYGISYLSFTQNIESLNFFYNPDGLGFYDIKNFDPILDDRLEMEIDIEFKKYYIGLAYIIQNSTYNLRSDFFVGVEKSTQKGSFNFIKINIGIYF